MFRSNYLASLLLIPLMVAVSQWGGWSILLVLAATWWLFPLLDQVFGRDPTNPDEAARLNSLFWYRAITLIWAPLQFGLVFGLIAYLATNPAHLTLAEKFGLAASLGVVTGMIGINYSHELMHRPTRLERGLADILLAMTLIRISKPNIFWCIISMWPPRVTLLLRDIMRGFTAFSRVF